MGEYIDFIQYLVELLFGVFLDLYLFYGSDFLGYLVFGLPDLSVASFAYYFEDLISLHNVDIFTFDVVFDAEPMIPDGCILFYYRIFEVGVAFI